VLLVNCAQLAERYPPGVIPAQAGIHYIDRDTTNVELDPRLRGDDESVASRKRTWYVFFFSGTRRAVLRSSLDTSTTRRH
jgi:hypothetical protein